MNRLPKLLIAFAAMATTPVSALAQTWPAAVVAVAPKLIAQPRRPTLTTPYDFTLRRPGAAAQIDRRFAGDPALRLNAAPEPDDLPDVLLRAKDEWTDDQGLRVSATRLAFKSRF